MRVPTRYCSSNEDNAGAKVNSYVVSAEPCKLLTLHGYNAGPQQYIHIHFTAAQPEEGTKPAFPPILVAANSWFNADFGVHGVDCDALTVCNSSTDPGVTIGAADCEFFAVLHG